MVQHSKFVIRDVDRLAFVGQVYSDAGAVAGRLARAGGQTGRPSSQGTAGRRFGMLARMATTESPMLRLSVVGHTNVGKTSLMRTLMRDATFGEVAPTAATTRRVAGARLLVAGRPVVELYDTPGLEDAGALIELLERPSTERHAGPERIQRFLASTEASGRFEQEARVLDQVLQSDAALYVIDVREPVLGKYQDELAILALCARPILPVLNFVAGARARPGEWRDALARVGLHAVAEFDNVVFSLESEARLWRRLATLVDHHAAALESLVAEREAQAGWQRKAALTMLADLLVDAAAARRWADRGDAGALDRARRDLHAAVQAREREFARRLLELYRFDPDAHAAVPLPIDERGWQHSLFDAEILGLIGRGTGQGAAAGAAAGAAVDVATGGLSLGAGTLIGALAGGGAGAVWQLRRDLADRLRGRAVLQLDDAALTHLGARGTALIDALHQRGHAAQTPVEIARSATPPWPENRLPKTLRRARLEPGLSTLNPDTRRDGDARDELIRKLAEAFGTGA